MSKPAAPGERADGSRADEARPEKCGRTGRGGGGCFSGTRESDEEGPEPWAAKRAARASQAGPLIGCAARPSPPKRAPRDSPTRPLSSRRRFPFFLKKKVFASSSRGQASSEQAVGPPQVGGRKKWPAVRWASEAGVLPTCPSWLERLGVHRASRQILLCQNFQHQVGLGRLSWLCLSSPQLPRTYMVLLQGPTPSPPPPFLASTPSFSRSATRINPLLPHFSRSPATAHGCRAHRVHRAEPT